MSALFSANGLFASQRRKSHNLLGTLFWEKPLSRNLTRHPWETFMDSEILRISKRLNHKKTEEKSSSSILDFIRMDQWSMTTTSQTGAYEKNQAKYKFNGLLYFKSVYGTRYVRWGSVRGETKFINWSRAAPRRGSRTRRDWVSDPAGVAHRPLAPTLPSRDGPVHVGDWAGPYHQRLRPSRPGDPRQKN